MKNTELELSQEELKLARDWIKDCGWGDIEDEDVDDLTDKQVEKAVQKFYDGGINSFKNDAQHF
ncbi:peptide ABC transporter substrate-binding protein [Anabaena cylindrica FACHB-243]|uniref:Oligopeptide transporter substrate binding protein n=1 Tax=Anabaena cylindrica (strain ATCC 27899 / PCC 7122) TaxID=272123 RepID=K9ZPU0_ANACC|nr:MULTISPECIES: hypothetical protein [Anabaena]AFZ61228.1 oligopeptide transporter substrate binding protein [Anabaena cylindrica PCC 7122]AZL96603.1 oligopeptide transporter substrate binding protein [Anabaena sp. CCAP 1446/1C]MBD2416654.1 peptide ABC transporter substrate-binding protein [Anabaena cylindrica FACHB-243]MBY5281108.1 peptide ABC transporter substrate-binding protein [Anabaena sp. CCAP 1446/1C]MBY5306734.1 peptide ABC transporter substrate-binding protein [Anabaena sp. CCAP 144